MIVSNNYLPKRSIAYIESFGLDPLSFSRDNWDQTGFYKFHDGRGRKGRLGTWTPYPGGFRVDILAGLFDLDRKAPLV